MKTQTKDLLEIARRYHQRLADLYADVEKQDRGERIHVLLDYLRRHEQHLEEALESVSEETRDQVRNHWFDFLPGDTPLTELPEDALRHITSAEDITTQALEFDRKLIEWYRMMSERAIVPHVQEFFEQLLAMEEREQIQMARDTLELNDL